MIKMFSEDEKARIDMLIDQLSLIIDAMEGLCFAAEDEMGLDYMNGNTYSIHIIQNIHQTLTEIIPVVIADRAYMAEYHKEEFDPIISGLLKNWYVEASKLLEGRGKLPKDFEIDPIFEEDSKGDPDELQ